MNNGQLRPTPAKHPNPCHQITLALWPPATWSAPNVTKPRRGRGGDRWTRMSINRLEILKPKTIARVMSSLPPAEVMDTMAGAGAAALPTPPKGQTSILPRPQCPPRCPTRNSEPIPKGELKYTGSRAAIKSTKTPLPTKIDLVEDTRDSETTTEEESKDTRNRVKWQSAQWQGDQEGGKHLCITALPTPLKDVNTVEHSHRHSITNWKVELKSLKRSMAKAGTEETGPPELPSLLFPEEQAARRSSGWPRMAGSVAFSGVVTSETLAEKISRLGQAGGWVQGRIHPTCKQVCCYSPRPLAEYVHQRARGGGDNRAGKDTTGAPQETGGGEDSQCLQQ